MTMNTEPLTEESIADLKEKIIDRLRTVYDPEIPLNVYDLGLIYRFGFERAEKEGLYNLEVDMTLTAPGCPLADQIVGMVRSVLVDLPELDSVSVNLVWDPPWDKSRMTDEALLQLDMF
jgi:metal-sulfur cluster biosynthetic enzyme